MNMVHAALMLAVPLAMAWAVLSALYWYVARPVLHSWIRFRLFEKRDQVRALGIWKKVDPQSFSFRYLEKWMCRAIVASPHLTLQMFIRFCVSEEARSASAEIQRFKREASPELTRLFADSALNVYAMMLVNSPILSLLGVVAGLMQRPRRFTTQKTMLMLDDDELPVHAALA